VVTVFDLKLLYYEALPNFQEEWIHDIGLNTVSTALGFLPSDLREQDAREMDEILCNTLNAHSESRVIAAKEKQDAEAKAIEPVGKQIDDLRKKCRMTVEELADALDVTPRSVYRHLSGKADPRARQIAAYEKLFSQKLNKSVRLDTSVERQTSSKRQ
jgi:DNA-binding XRE family transcriptional regulator